MARRSISIDEKIKKQKEVVASTKDKYDAAVDYFTRMSPVRNEVPYHPSPVLDPSIRGWNPLYL